MNTLKSSSNRNKVNMPQESIEKTFEVESPAKLIVKNIRGSIVIKPGDEGQIKINAVKHLDSGFPEETNIEISQNGNGEVCVTTQHTHNGFWKSGRPCKVDYQIFAPKSCSVNLKTVSSSADVEGLEGDFKINSVSGTVKLTELSGSINAKNVSGKLLGENLSGPAKLESISGEIRAEDSNLLSLNSTTVSGSAIIHTDLGDGPYKLSSISGSAKLVVPENTKCSVHAKSISGRFHTDLNASFSSINRRSWDVDLEGGGTEIRMNSVSGNLYVVTSEDVSGVTPRVKHKTREERFEVLTQLEGGNISVEDALSKLGI